MCRRPLNFVMQQQLVAAEGVENKSGQDRSEVGDRREDGNSGEAAIFGSSVTIIWVIICAHASTFSRLVRLPLSYGHTVD